MSTRPERPRHFSMLRELQLADVFTLGNAACGMGSVFFAMFYVADQQLSHFFTAAALAPLAFIFDVLDGRIARWRHAHSALGRELDSLADVISFGVGPATLAFAAGMRGGWDLAVLIYFVCCGVSRLARFNVTAESLAEGSDSGKVAYFEGTPIPTSVLLTAVLAWCAWQGQLGGELPGGAWVLGPTVLHPLVLLFALSGTLMVSKTLRIPKF
ncbi:CDP-alcohol phosphatidyltransferase family protein [Cupriavidus necator]|jgi:CDP-diacylglycerol--serine O-phosphatidyltransferase|uniref:CDP-diacylglycerol-serine O-phosphatidyltransferase n=2 Tax=Cupriavidus necator TaxID=106590 RepID=F8GM31_CUPNN|nr:MULTISPECIES: CDP-alcohol phosphatidyltransferase family protein [Cupriavidus]AEI80050.1 CDP-diacylglycerol-serine O-phosphatidyltransferase [Cupriavidus necator N-1]KAI3599310.1 CDP-diacylglycerol--serine O-phosphatidyltransferase [Cupriavidus necator H850]MDX6010316.1 CDP-alcohol phosphatidyltransferase family protein [Cupriavidus necator]QQX88374.1 CDP-alcohol phosphatidyltransferase family protein [Cupriavidus necator]QUN30277.1 CDP-alcohol phosphatidyltransferase family protein [Cupria